MFTLSSIIFFGDDFCTEPKMPVVAKAPFMCGIKMWASIIKNMMQFTCCAVSFAGCAGGKRGTVMIGIWLSMGHVQAEAT